ncbi:hypothetical protein D0T87_01870 [Bacteroides sp. 51]|nr:hypothetical protein [Bacteroides sp. 51]
MVHLLLDYFAEKLPDESDIKLMAPLIRRRWFWNNSMDYCHSDSGKLPEEAVYVGNIPLLVTGECNVYGGWPTGHDFIDELEWQKIPEQARNNFKNALSDTTEIEVSGVKCRRSWQHIDDELLSAMTDYSKDLARLPAAYTFVATKYYPQLVPFLETRWTASKLDWTGHGQQELDLSRTHLREITLWDESLKQIKLPQSCRTLTLNGKLHSNLKVTAPDNGHKLTLHINVKKQDNIIPNLGILQLNALALHFVEDTDLTPVHAYYPHLTWLRIIGKPGNITHIGSLAKLPELKSLLIEDVFGFVGEEFPQPAAWPKLKTLWVESIPQEAGQHIKKLFRGKIIELDVRKLRKPEWLAENLDNPLRHWDGSEFVPRGKAKKAAQIYRDTRRSALLAAHIFTTDKDVDKLSAKLDEIAKEYVIAFNKLDGRTNFIETEEREDICAAFEIILEAVQTEVVETDYKIPSQHIYEVMDEHRDW